MSIFNVRSMRVTIIILFCLFTFSTPAVVHAKMTCKLAFATMDNCFEFLRGEGPPKLGEPTAKCCTAVHSLYSKCKTAADRATTCNCFKKSGPGLGFAPDRAQDLPNLCGINSRGLQHSILCTARLE